MGGTDNILAGLEGLFGGISSVAVPILTHRANAGYDAELRRKQMEQEYQQKISFLPHETQAANQKAQYAAGLQPREVVRNLNQETGQQVGDTFYGEPNENLKFNMVGGSKSLKPGNAGGMIALYDQDMNIIGYVPRGARPAPKATDAQSITGAYANRMEQANLIFNKLDGYAANANPLAFSGQSKLPDVANFLKSNNFQSVEQAQRNFLNAVLRRESGAVISPTEFTEGKKQYFAQPGDTPETVAQKAQTRGLVIEEFKKSAGLGYSPSAIMTAPASGTGGAQPSGATQQNDLRIGGTFNGKKILSIKRIP